MKRYSIYTSAVSYKDEYQPKEKTFGSDTAVYVRRVNANSRLQALEKCLVDLKKELPKVKGKYLSVFVGETFNPSAFANRLMPFQIIIETGEIRKK